jgi:hypothetical protein
VSFLSAVSSVRLARDNSSRGVMLRYPR